MYAKARFPKNPHSAAGLRGAGAVSEIFGAWEKAALAVMCYHSPMRYLVCVPRGPHVSASFEDAADQRRACCCYGYVFGGNIMSFITVKDQQSMWAV